MDGELKAQVLAGKHLHPDRMKVFVRKYWFAAVFFIIMVIGGFAMLLQDVPYNNDAALGMWLLGVAVLVACSAHTVLYCDSTMIYLEKEEVVLERGILEKQKVRVALHMITDTKLERDILDKMLGTAVIMINTSGTSGYEIVGRFESGALEAMNSEIYRLVSKTSQSIPNKDAKPENKKS